MASAALMNVYRQVEAGSLEMVRAPEPEPDVPKLGIAFGAQCGWSPAREGGTIDLPATAPDGLPCVVAVCGECGSGFTADTLPDSVACGGCLRSCLDDRIAVISRDYPPPAKGLPGPLEAIEAEAERAKESRRKPKADASQ